MLFIWEPLDLEATTSLQPVYQDGCFPCKRFDWETNQLNRLPRRRDHDLSRLGRLVPNPIPNGIYNG